MRRTRFHGVILLASLLVLVCCYERCVGASADQGEKFLRSAVRFTKGGVIKNPTGTAPKLQNVSYSTKDGIFLGASVDVATINVDYEDTLNVLDSDFWCPNECWVKQGSSCACDYTRPNKGDCRDKKKSNDKNNTCDDECTPTKEDYDLYCSTEPRRFVEDVAPSRPAKGWMVLEDGVISTEYVLYELNDVRYFRFHTSESCRYLRVMTVPTKGNLRLEVATPKTWSNDLPFVYSSQRVNYNEISVCPSDEYFAPGTFYIRVSATTVYTKFTILVETIDLPEDSKVDEACNPVRDDMDCLTPGLPIQFFTTDSEEYHYTVTLPKASVDNGPCSEVYVGMVQASAFGGDADISISFTSPDVSAYDETPVADINSWNFGNDRITLSICLSAERETTFYVSVVSYQSALVDTWPLRLIFTPSATFYRTGLLDLPSDIYNDLLISSSHMVCNGKKYQCRWSGSSSDCMQIAFIIPDRDPQPFYPPPSFFSLFSSSSKYTTNYTNPELPSQPVSTRYSLLYLLSSQSSENTVVNLEASQLKECRIVFNNFIVNDKLIPLERNVENLREVSPKCDVDSLNVVDNKIRNYIELLREESEEYLQRSYRYTIDSLAFSNNFTSCIDLVQSLLEENGFKTVTVINTTVCSIAYNSSRFEKDPCCNLPIGWDGDCCRPKTIKTKEQSYALNHQEISNKCDDTQCVESYTSDFILEQKKLKQSAFGCDDPSASYKKFLEVEWKPYVDCRDSIFGINHTLGLNCEVDSDCVDNKCNTLTGYCLNEIDKQEQRFMECLLSDLDPYILGYLKLKYSIDSDEPTSKQFVTDLRKGWSGNDCVSKYELGLPYRNSYFWGPRYDFSVCESTCKYFHDIDPIPTFPFACAAPSGFCVFTMYPPLGADPDSCKESKVCNWMNCTLLGYPADVCEDECLSSNYSDYFCGLCENGVECVEFPELNSKEACESAQACVYDLQAVALNQEECKSRSYCTTPCYDVLGDGEVTTRKCISREECEGSGVCGRALDYLSEKGSCVFPLPPYQSPACGGYYYHYGGVPSEIGCVDSTINKTDCEDEQGEWVFPAITREECESYGDGCNEVVTFGRYLNFEITTRKNNRECKRCGGDTVPLLRWQGGKWRESSSRQLQWKKRDYVQKFDWSETLAFYRIYEDISSAIASKFAVSLRNEIQCRFSKIMELTEGLSCDCASDEGEACFDNFDGEVPSGSVIVCTTEETTLRVPPDVVRFPFGAVESRVGCSNVSVSLISALQFQSPQEKSLSSYLIGAKQPEEEYSFLNDYEAEVGQVFGDGIKITADGPQVRRVEVCAAEREEISLNTKKFPIRDFALPSSGLNQLKPQGLSLYQTPNGLWCAEIDDPVSQPYYPVIRMNGWENEVPYSEADLILMYIAASLYALNTIYSFIQLLEFVVFKKLKFRPNNHILWMIMLLNLIRSIFFYLMATQVLRNAPTFIEILLVEAPAFLYFMTFSFFVLLFMSGVNYLRKKYFYFTIFLNVFFIGLLLALILLFEFLPENDTSACGGRIYEPLPSWTGRRIVNAVYRILIATIAFILASFVFVYGLKLYSMLNKLRDDQPGQKHQNRKRVVFLLTAFCAVGLMIQSIYLIILVGSGEQNNIATIVILIVSEVILSFVLLALLHPGRVQGHYFGQSLTTNVFTSSRDSKANTSSTSSSK